MGGGGRFNRNQGRFDDRGNNFYGGGRNANRNNYGNGSGYGHRRDDRQGVIYRYSTNLQ